MGKCKPKKVLFISLISMLILACFNVNAQTTTDDGGYYYSCVLSSKDTVTSNQVSKSYILNYKAPQVHYYNFNVSVSETSSNFACIDSLFGKVHPNDSYTFISRKVYTGVGTDTTFNFTQSSTKQFYRYYNHKINRTSGKGKINYIYASFKY